jgi:hypothetical protein
VNIKLTRAPASFYLLGAADDLKEGLKFLNVTLFVTQIELRPSMLLDHTKVLSQKKDQCR